MKKPKTLPMLMFRLKLRRNLQKEAWDIVHITYEESKKELERRIKRK